jgi:hypothetical protein
MPSPAPPLPERAPDPSDRVAYGKYLTTMASCASCHTKMERGRPVPGMAFAGGLKFQTRSSGVQYSANITPDLETGIGRWTVEQFVARFKSVADVDEASLNDDLLLLNQREACRKRLRFQTLVIHRCHRSRCQILRAYEETTSARVRSMDASMKRWTEWRELRKHVLLERGQRATDPSL